MVIEEELVLEFEIIKDKLVYSYFPEYGIKWIKESFDKDYEVTLKKVFTVNKSNLLDYAENEHGETGVRVILGKLKDSYIKIFDGVITDDIEIYIHENVDLYLGFFRLPYGISLFSWIGKTIRNEVKKIYIGGELETISVKALENIKSKFPSTYERELYYRSRVSNILSEEIFDIIDYEFKFNNYMKDKIKSFIGESITENLSKYEKEKYSYIVSKLEDMLKKKDKYLEKQWQKEILEIITFIYPEYIKVLEKVRIKDSYTDGFRELDYLAINNSGNVDIIEIKKPGKKILSPGVYRDNYIPSHELSGTIMQVENYILNLLKWGQAGEKVLNQKYANDLPEKLKISVVNPKGILILGSEGDLSKKEIIDYEIIKRKYSNIISIITYEELIRRLKFIIDKFK